MTESVQEESIDETSVAGTPPEAPEVHETVDKVAENAGEKLSAGERLRREKSAAAARKAAIKAKVREEQDASVITTAQRPAKPIDFDKTDAGRAVKQTVSWFEKNRSAVFGAIAAAVLLIAGFAFWSSHQSAANANIGKSLYDGIHASSGVVQAAGETAPEGVRPEDIFETVAARNAAASSKFALVTEGPGTAWARVGEARIALASGDYAAAERKFDEVYRAFTGNGFIASTALEGVAIAREQQNNLRGALDAYQTLGSLSNNRYRAQSELGIARIKVRRNEGQDHTEARTSLRELVERLRNEQRAEDGERTFEAPFTLSQAETLLRVLDPTAAQPSSPGLDGLSQEQLQELLQRLGQGQQ